MTSALADLIQAKLCWFASEHVDKCSLSHNGISNLLRNIESSLLDFDGLLSHTGNFWKEEVDSRIFFNFLIIPFEPLFKIKNNP